MKPKQKPPANKRCGKCKKFKGKGDTKCKCGRPLFSGKNEDDVKGKLELAYSYGCTDKEACCLADISLSALYDYQTSHPEFLERKEVLKEKPMLLARQTILNAVKSTPLDAWKYVSKKRKDEFGEDVELPADSQVLITIKKPSNDNR